MCMVDDSEPFAVSNETTPKARKATKCDELGLGQPGGLPPKQLARDLGVDVKTIYGWMAGNGMRADHFVALIDLMPASFGNFVLAPTGATLVKLADKRAALERAQQEYEEAVAIAGGGR